MISLFGKNEPVPTLLERLKTSVGKTKAALSEAVDNVFLGERKIDPSILKGLETALLSADLGVKPTREILDAVREKLDRNALADSAQLKREIKSHLVRILNAPMKPDVPSGSGIAVSQNGSGTRVIFIVGVNGAGKTTSIGKLANRLRQEGRSVVLCAADTFRAAAVEQLTTITGPEAQHRLVALFATPDLVEACAESDRHELALPALERFERWSEAGSPWASAVLPRLRGCLAEGEEAERLLQVALLNGRQRVVENRERRALLPQDFPDLLDLARAGEQGGIGTVAAPAHQGPRLNSCARGKLAELFDALVVAALAKIQPHEDGNFAPRRTLSHHVRSETITNPYQLSGECSTARLTAREGTTVEIACL